MSDNLIVKLNSVSVAYCIEKGETAVLKDLSLEIAAGEFVALVGPSGSGKSTVGKLILNALPGSAKTIGSIEANSKTFEIRNWDPEEAGVLTAYIPQEPWTVMSDYSTIGEQLAIYLREFADKPLTPVEENNLVIQLLKKVQLSKAEKRLNDYPFNFSGGEQQRIAIAMAIAKRARLIIADEPTASLDPDIRFEIYKLLKGLSDSGDVATLVITHDVSTVLSFANKVLALENGKTEVWSKPQGESDSRGVKKRAKTKKSRSLTNNLEVKNLTVFFSETRSRDKATKKVLGPLSFTLEGGNIMGLIGPSGSGKTTLGRAIAGLVEHGGDIDFDFGQGRQKINTFVRSKIGYVFQDASVSLNPLMRVGEIVSEPLRVHSKHLSKSERGEVITSVLESLELPLALLDRLPKELSGGERQRVNLARALILKPQLIIADEPTSALNPELELEILNKLVGSQEEVGFSIIFVSHDMKIIEKFTDKVMVLDAGEVSEYGKTDEIFASPASKFLRASLGLDT